MALTVAKSALEAIREKGLGGFMRMIREEGFLLVLFSILSSSSLLYFFSLSFVRSQKILGIRKSFRPFSQFIFKEWL